MVSEQDVPDINVGNISNRTPQLAIFDFRSFLNLAMLLVESPTAKSLRQVMLDIVIDFINQKAGGATKYINQRDSDFIGAFLQEENYRKEFTDLSIAETFLSKTENISLNVAASKIDKELLYKIMEAIMDGSYDENEALKLEIYNAINREM